VAQRGTEQICAEEEAKLTAITVRALPRAGTPEDKLSERHFKQLSYALGLFCLRESRSASVALQYSRGNVP
jgi:hypothetical protein